MAIHALSAWERIEIARHPKRPKFSDYLRCVLDKFSELHGDRIYGDDPALIGGLARLGDQALMVIGQEKGSDTESRLRRNFGMCKPEGYRKALRLMKLAEKFRLPVLCLIDTPGAYPGLEAEERGQGWAIAENLKAMATLQVPIVSLIIGEGCSGGALGLGLADVVAMLEHSYYSVISPEGCAQILWREEGKKRQAAESLQLTSEKLLQFEVVDTVIQEPHMGAHCDEAAVFVAVRHFLQKRIAQLMDLDLKCLLSQRGEKFRKLGCFTTQTNLISS